MTAHRSKTAHHQKHRHGKHQKHTKQFLRVYWPYMPAVIIMVASLLVSGLQFSGFKPGVLAYATEMSRTGLLNATNTQRSKNNRSSLKLNSSLNSAAQAKANDMAKKDYWSHNTPDGKEPWVFIDSAGYDYLKAGENLAYGFGTSNETVIGWMNSATHKANLLDKEFSDVGFGYVNSSDYQNNGKQTIVVAMYGKPQTLGASAGSQQPTPPPATQPKKPVSPSPAAPAEPKPKEKQPAAEVKPAAPITTEQPIPDDQTSQPITRLETLSGGQVPWAGFAVGLMSGGAASVLLINHSLRLKKLLKKSNRYLKRGESFILHHPVLDATMISLIVLGLALSQTMGNIL